MTETDLDQIAERVALRMPRRERPWWLQVAQVLIAALGITALPWAKWVTDSIYRLDPTAARYTQQVAAIEHAAMRDQIRSELAEELRGVRVELSTQNKLLADMNLKLARKGIE